MHAMCIAPVPKHPLAGGKRFTNQHWLHKCYWVPHKSPKQHPFLVFCLPKFIKHLMFPTFTFWPCGDHPRPIAKLNWEAVSKLHVAKAMEVEGVGATMLNKLGY